jgi:hypothetical protein
LSKKKVFVKASIWSEGRQLLIELLSERIALRPGEQFMYDVSIAVWFLSRRTL